MAYTYGSITRNNGSKFRARRDEETGKVAYMDHHGQQNASAKIAKSFRPNATAEVPADNRYRFPDEYDNEHLGHTSSHQNRWVEH